MTIHIITVGTSIVMRGLVGQAPAPLEGTDAYEQACADFGSVHPLGIGETVSDHDADRIRTYRAALPAINWIHVSPEQTGPGLLARERGLPPESWLAPGDVAVFVSTDSPEGRDAAYWNALLAVDGDVEKCHPGFRTEDIEAGRLKNGHVYVVTLPQFNPRNPEKFGDSIGAFGASLYSLVNAVAVPDDFHFHLSGGLKTALPFFLCTVDWLAGAKKRVGVEASAVFEDGSMLVRFPIRPLQADPAEVEFVLDLIDDNEGANQGGSLEGYAYVRDEFGIAHVTGLGHAYGAFIRSLG